MALLIMVRFSGSVDNLSLPESPKLIEIMQAQKKSPKVSTLWPFFIFGIKGCFGYAWPNIINQINARNTQGDE
jgi:hypothetical protein